MCAYVYAYIYSHSYMHAYRPEQRRQLARGDGLPAATLALHCLLSSLAGRWSCGGPQVHK